MRRRGFTLVEVMAALAVLGLAVFMLLDAHYGGLRLHNAARDRVVLNQLLTHAVGIAKTEAASGSLSGSGGFGVRFEDYGYRYEAVAQSAEERPGLYALRVVVEGPGDGDTYETVVMLFLPNVLEGRV